MSAVVLLLALSCLACFARAWDNDSTPLSTFRSRPDLLSTSLQVTLYEEGAVDPGLVFIGAYQTEQPGPYIFDKRGNLVWSGFANVGAENAHNLHVCEYAGSPHLCMFQGHQYFGFARGHGVILDTDYRVVASVQAGGDAVPIDQHEFRVIDGGQSALVAIYQQQAFDMSRVGITGSQGWLMDSMFQEVNVTDGSVLFEWSAAQHVDPFRSYVYPKASDIVGDGLSPLSAWDFFHLNSIGKSQMTGNYIISARHMSTIYYVDGRNGSIIWRLQSGGDSDFVCADFNFAFQHDTQIRAENETSMTLSIFDNASNGHNRTTERSRTKIVTLDYASRTAKLDLEIPYPGEDLHVPSQGNTQVLNNSNIFVGYGGWPRMSEHAPDGRPVWMGQFGASEGVVMSYRSSSAAWHAVPSRTRPSLWSYSKDAGAPVVMYVSWNGCTEVESWNFYGADTAGGVMSKMGSVRRTGFETSFMSDTHFVYTMAEAVDYGGRALRNSSVVQAFLPSAELAVACSETGCLGA